MNALKQYSNVVESDTCAVERFENAVSEIVFRIISNYPCLVEAKFASVEAQCPDASKFMCGKKLPYFETSTIAVSQCRHAIRNYCSPLSLASSDSPYGITEGGTAVCACDQHSGVCETTSNNTNWPSPMNVSLYSLLCDPTGPFTENLATNGTSRQYNVSIGNSTLLPKYAAYFDLPLKWSIPGMYELVEMLPAMVGNIAYASNCPRGYYCDGVRQGYLVECVGNTWCPTSQITPRSCGILGICFTGQDNGLRGSKVQLLGVVIGGGALVLALFVLCCCGAHTCMLKRKATKARLHLDSTVINDVDVGYDDYDERVTAKDVENVMGDDEEQRLLSSGALLSQVMQLQGISVAFKQLTIENRLHASGVFQKGKLTVVLGASGSGKTTLLNALLDEIPVDAGDLFVDGQRRALHSVGFVPQFEHLSKGMTVNETLTHAAKIHLPDLSSSEIARRVEETLEALLLAPCKHQFVGGGTLSGGQLKRISIGIELIARPKILFCDEPTTGLDSFTALEIMQTLKASALAGCTVVCVLHTPRESILECVDSLLVLVRGGYSVFQGTVTRAQQLCADDHLQNPDLDNANVAERLVERQWDVSVDRVDEVVDELVTGQHQPDAHHRRHGESAAKTANLLRQTALCAKRALIQRLRSPGNMIALMVVHVIAAIVLGLPFLLKVQGVIKPPIPHDIAILCPPALRHYCMTEPIDWVGLQLSAFYLNLALGVAGFVAACFTFGNKLLVIERETASGASSVAIALGSFLVDIPFFALYSLLFAGTFTALLVGNNEFHENLLICVGIEFCVMGVGYTLSMVMDLGKAIVTGMTLIFGWTIASGIVPKLRVVEEQFGPFGVLWHTSYARYSVEAEVLTNTEIFLDPRNAFAVSTETFIKEYGWHRQNFVFDIIMLFVLGIAWRLLALLLLRIYHGRAINWQRLSKRLCK